MPHFIMESPIFQEAKIIQTKDPKKAIFRMTMQTLDEENQNHRVYPGKVVTDSLKECQTRMQRRAWLGELDHPFPQGNDSFDEVRQTTVSLKEVSHLIRDYEVNGNRVVGELETTHTPNGNILLGLLKDQSGIGLSLRGMAHLERRGNTNYVQPPLLIITYDGVSLPSHSAAVVNFNEMKFESCMLNESKGLVCVGGKCYLPEYFDKLVETKVIQFFERWV